MSYNLLPAQSEFLQVPHNKELDIALYQGGFGSGKTFSGSLLGVLLCKKYPGIRGLVGAQTLPLVRDTTLNQGYLYHLEQMGFKEGVHYTFKKSEYKIVFANKSEILFRYFDDASKIKSLDLGFAEIEEMSDVPESVFKMLLGRMRQAGIPKRRIFGHTNPEQYKGWIYKYFLDDAESQTVRYIQDGKEYYYKKLLKTELIEVEGETIELNFRTIIAPSIQNIHLPRIQLAAMQSTYDPEYYNINVLGEHGDYLSGLVTKGFINKCKKNPHGEWDYSDDSNVRPINYCNDLPVHIVCDFNVDPMCWTLAHKTDTNVYFFDEFGIENTTTQQVIDIIIDKYKDHKGGFIINGDASGDYRDTKSLYTDYAIIKNALQKAKLERVTNLRAFNPPRKHRIAAWNHKMRDKNGYPHLFFDPSMTRAIECIENLKIKPGTSEFELPTTKQIKEDNSLKWLPHFFDMSYLVEYYFPVLPVITHSAEKETMSITESFKKQGR